MFTRETMMSREIRKEEAWGNVTPRKTLGVKSGEVGLGYNFEFKISRVL